MLNENYTESGKIVAKIHSDEKNNTERCFDAEYRLYPEDHSIFSMRGSLILSDDRGKPHSTHFEGLYIQGTARAKAEVGSKKRSIEKSVSAEVKYQAIDPQKPVEYGKLYFRNP